jgi:hypothetical protein
LSNECSEKAPVSMSYTPFLNGIRLRRGSPITGMTIFNAQ